MGREADRLRIKALDRLVFEMFQARDRAIETLATETKQVRAQSNEWRGSLNDLSNTKVDKETFKALEQKVDLLREEVAQSRGAGAGSLRLQTILFAIGGAVVGIIGLALTAAAVFK